MKIPTTPSFIESDDTWYQKGHGAIFIEKEEHREPVFKILCEQDDYWEDYWKDELERIIHIAPKEANSRSELLSDNYVNVGKVAIYDVKGFIAKCAEQGMDVLILSETCNCY
jgi:hypothetical protein